MRVKSRKAVRRCRVVLTGRRGVVSSKGIRDEVAALRDIAKDQRWPELGSCSVDFRNAQIIASSEMFLYMSYMPPSMLEHGRCYHG